jgi:Tetracyclin repressor-like, C-terminal domain
MTDYEWWSANAPLLERVFDAGSYPTASRVGTAAAAAYGGSYDPEHAFDFGLQRVLDGIEAFVQARSAQADRQ